MPEVTVLMPVYNGASFLDHAVNSVLEQSYGDFEFLIIDDASTDETPDIIRRYCDSRIRYLRNGQNLGVAGTLNRGLEEARGSYIARMDVDDESCPERLARQVAYMQVHPDTGVIGSWARFMGAHMGAVLRRPCGAAIVRASLCLDNPLTHPTVMIRKSVLDKHNLRYDGRFNRSEDFDLWLRMSRLCDLDNLPEVLLKYRVHGSSVTSVARKDMENQSIDLLRRALLRIGVVLEENDIAFYRDAGSGKRFSSRTDLEKAEALFGSLIKVNERTKQHKTEALAAAVSFAWFRLCFNNAQLGPWIWGKYRDSILRADYAASRDELTRFAFGIAWHLARPRGNAK